MKLRFLCLLFLLILLPNVLLSQELNVKAVIDTNDVLIGDWIKLTLVAKSTKQTRIIFPAIGDTIGKIEVVSRGKIDTIKEKDGLTFKRDFTLSAYDSGSFTVPSQTFMYERTGFESLFAAATDSIVLRYHSIPVDTTLPIKDIKGPLDELWTLAEIMPYILIVLGIVLLAVLVIYLLKRYKPKPKPSVKYDPTIPADVEALRAFRILEQEKLWQKGEVKKYYVRLTEIIRIYFERRYEIPAMETTSVEIIDDLKKQDIRYELIEQMSSVFETADLVKFAKFLPLPDVNAKCLSQSIDFVEKTKQNIEPDKKDNLEIQSNASISQENEKTINKNSNSTITKSNENNHKEMEN